MSSTWGKNIKISIFGGSHTKAIGVTIDGFPAGIKIDMDKLFIQMKRRAPGGDKTSTARKEDDLPDFICGIDENNITSGDPITALIYNNNQHSKDYESLRYTPRPGHADFTAYHKYHGKNDIRGGGHFSGRLTAPIVIAGALCRQLLEEKDIYIGAHVSSIGKVEDDRIDNVNINKEILCKLNSEFFSTISKSAKEEMYTLVESVKNDNNSIGGTVECAAIGLPVGIGEQMFGGVENRIASIAFGIPAVKGIEFGAGFAAAKMNGDENNDEFYYDENNLVKTKTNNSGGILGGITNGMPLVFRVAIKPTPSIAKEQNTINLKDQKNAKLEIKGRHDPCIVPRAVPVVEAITAISILDMYLDNFSI